MLYYVMNNSKKKFLPHVHLEKLIREKFNPYLVVNHVRFESPVLNEKNKAIIARTIVRAYPSKGSKEDEVIAYAYSECSAEDKFERAKGLTVAYRRLYREMADAKKNEKN